MSKLSGRLKKAHEVRRQRGIVRDQRGQDQPASKEDAQRSSGDVRPNANRSERKSKSRRTARSDANTHEREVHLRELASKLFFTVDKNGDRFILKRTVDVSEPVCENNLSLNEAERLLEVWKLRGLHGG